MTSGGTNARGGPAHSEGFIWNPVNTPWLEIRAEGGQETKDLASFILIEAGSPAVVEKGGSKLLAFLPVTVDIRALRKKLEKTGWKFVISPYREENWAEKWKRYIRPVRAGGFLIIPTWSRVKKRKEEVLIQIDPGMAFGTGAHPTTKMSLKAIALLSKNKRASTLLDVGTGSGILAIAAKKLGVRNVTGIDNDPIALKVAGKNAFLNNVNVTFSKKPAGKITGVFETVVANIQSNTLLSISSLLTEKVKPGGFLVLSGILKEEISLIREAYIESGFIPFKALKSREWAALIMRRPGQ